MVLIFTISLSFEVKITNTLKLVSDIKGYPYNRGKQLAKKSLPQHLLLRLFYYIALV